MLQENYQIFLLLKCQYRFMPSYKRRIWDGKIRLYSVATNEVYVGLLPYIEEFAKRNEIDIEYKRGYIK